MGQSFPGVLAAVALPAVFRQNGMPLEMFWLFALPLIPSWLRFLMALVVDNYGSVSLGFRKSWIVPCTLLGAVLYLFIGNVEPELHNLWLIIGLLCLKSTIMTAQDVAVDGLAVESFTAQERPLGAAIIVLLMFMGTVAGQGLVAAIDLLGWQPAMTSAAILLVVVAIPAIVRPEAAPPSAAITRRASGRSASISDFLARHETRLILPVLFLLGFSSNLLRAMLPVFLVDLGLSLADIGFSFGFAVVLGASLSLLTVPKLTKRIGPRNLIAWLVVGYLPCIPLFGLLQGSTPSLTNITAILTYAMFVSTAMWMLVMQERMAWSSKHQAATDFSLQGSVANLGEWMGATIAGFVVASLGWSLFFYLGWTVAAIAGLTLLLIINPVSLCLSRTE